MDLATTYIKMYEGMFGDRASWDSYFQEIAENIYPRKASFNTTQTQGRRLYAKTYDGTPMRSLGLLTSFLHSMVTNPAVLWFEYVPGNLDLMKKFSVRSALQDAARRMFVLLLASNFHSQIHEVYTDLGCFGNADIDIEPDPVRVFRFRARPLAEIAWDVNESDVVDTQCREYMMSAREMAKEFGPENLSEKAKVNLGQPDKFMLREFKVINILKPNEDFIPGSFDKEKRKYLGVYIELNSRHILNKTGWYEQPFAFGRWTVNSGEKVGRGPGEVALPEARLLHAVQRHTIRATQKATEPPLMVPNKAFLKPLMLSAGAVNYYKTKYANTSPQNIVQSLPTGTNFPVVYEEKRDIRQAVQECFFVDNLRIPRQDRMTAAEVHQHVTENQQFMAPYTMRIHNEILEPALVRAMWIAIRAGRIPPLPPELHGEQIKVRIVSPLAKAQRISEVQALMSVVDTLTPFAQIDPTILNVFKKPQLIEFVMNAFGAPLDVIKNPTELFEKIEAQEAAAEEQQAAMAQSESASNVAGAIKDVASATKDLGGLQRIRGMIQ